MQPSDHESNLAARAPRRDGSSPDDSSTKASTASSKSESRRPPLRLLTILAVVAASAVAIGSGSRWLENYHPVVPGVIYRSAQPTARSLRRYCENDGIRSVINLRGPWRNAGWYQEEIESADDLGIRHFDISLHTHRLAPLAELRKLVKTFDECPKPMLLHCRQGADRTSLACAIYMILYQNQTPQEAITQYRLDCFHTGWARGYHLPHMFDCYSEWLKREKREHSADDFREWINSEVTLGYFGAKLQIEEPPQKVSVGEPVKLIAKATNVSRTAWHCRAPADSGIHLVGWVGTPGKPLEEATMAVPAVAVVLPNETVAIEVALPPFLTPGPYEVFLDMRDEHEFKFCEMGIGGWRATIEATAEEAVDEKSAQRPVKDDPK